MGVLTPRRVDGVFDFFNGVFLSTSVCLFHQVIADGGDAENGGLGGRHLAQRQLEVKDFREDYLGR